MAYEESIQISNQISNQISSQLSGPLNLLHPAHNSNLKNSEQKNKKTIEKKSYEQVRLKTARAVNAHLGIRAAALSLEAVDSKSVGGSFRSAGGGTPTNFTGKKHYGRSVRPLLTRAIHSTRTFFDSFCLVKSRSSSDRHMRKTDHSLNTSNTRGFVHGIPTAGKVTSKRWSRTPNVATRKSES
jgi:hypothetical protein